jgi:hypothetical protein
MKYMQEFYMETSWKNGPQGCEVAQACLLALFILWQYIKCWDYKEANEKWWKNDEAIWKEIVVDNFLLLYYPGNLKTPEMGQVWIGSLLERVIYWCWANLFSLTFWVLVLLLVDVKEWREWLKLDLKA